MKTAHQMKRDIEDAEAARNDILAAVTGCTDYERRLRRTLPAAIHDTAAEREWRIAGAVIVNTMRGANYDAELDAIVSALERQWK